MRPVLFDQKTRTRWFLFFAVSLAVLQWGIFLAALNTASTDFSWGDLDWLHQRLYNFWHGRGFQTSVYRLASPLSYAHDFGNHLILTHYFLALPYKLFPNLNTFFLLAVAYNLASLFFFSRLFLSEKRGIVAAPLSGGDRAEIAALLPLLFVLWGPFFKAITHQCHPVLFAAPLFLASYYFLRKGRPWLFLACVAAVSLVQDDCAFWMACYCAYFYLFERERGVPVLLGGLFGAAVGFANAFYIQMDARWYADRAYDVDLVTTFYSVAANWLNRDSLLWTLRFYAVFIAEMSFPVLLLFLVRKFVRVPGRLWAFLVLAPLPYWTSFLVIRAAAHHYAPILWVVFLFFVEALPSVYAAVRAGPEKWPGRKVAAAAIVVLFGSLAASQLYGTILKATVLLRCYSLMPSRMYSLRQTESNRNTLKILSALPKDKSLCFWTARGLAGFLMERSDVWLFPYNFDRTDFLALQKNVENQAFFEITQDHASLKPDLLAKQELNSEYARLNKYCSSAAPCSVRPADADYFKDLLVGKRRTHVIHYEDEDVVVLKSIAPADIPRPRYTETLYWR